MLWFYLQFLPETFLILKRIQRDVGMNVNRYSCKESVILIRFYRNLNSIGRFSKYPETWNFMKIHSVWADRFMRKGGLTDMTKVIVVFRYFLKVPWMLARSSKDTLRNPTLWGSWHLETSPRHIAEEDDGLQTEAKLITVPVRALKTYRRSIDIFPRILNFGTT